MTMLSFRVDDTEAADAQRWADRLGVDRSQLLREALHRYLVQLESDLDADRWEQPPSPMPSAPSAPSPTGVRPKTGRTGPMRRGEIWFAATPGGDRPVLVLTRDPVADRIGWVVVAVLTRTRRGLASEMQLTAERDGVPTDCFVNFDNVHTIPREALRQPIVRLRPERLGEAGQRLRDATGC